MHETEFDVIVAGAGPAGTTAAALLAEKNYRVLILEKSTFPRYHIGESLIPFCYFPLKRLGMVEKLDARGFVSKQSVQFVGVDGRLSQPFYFVDHMDHDCSRTWQVDRATFDQMMLDNALEKGARVIFEMRVKNAIEARGRVTGVVAVDKQGEEHRFHAPITIDCTGQDSLMIKRNNWRVPEANLKKTALWTYYKGAKRAPGRDEGATTVAYLPEKAWFWHIPLADDMVSLGVVGDKQYLFSETNDPETIIKREIAKNPWVEDMVSGGVQCNGYHAARDFSYRSRYAARDGLVLAGDAFAFLDPVFSSGVFLALLSGELAADAIDKCHRDNDFSAEMFEDYALKFRQGIEAMRKIVYAFYDLNFNFKSLIKKYPHLHGDLTDCLIGNVFKDLNPLFAAIEEFAATPGVLPHGLPLYSGQVN